MKKVSIFLTLLLFVVAASDSSGRTVAYPKEQPALSITFPDTWQVERGELLLYAAPADESIVLELWALEDVDDAETAWESIDDIVADLVADPKWGKPQKTTINGIPFLTVDGKAKDEEDKPIAVSVALFSPEEGTVFILIHFGSIDAERKYERELRGIVNSIKPHRGR